MKKTRSDADPIETQEWIDALTSLIKREGKERAQYMLHRCLEEAKKKGVEVGLSQLITPYCNTISVEEQPDYPGDLDIENRIEAIIRWNALVMVIKAKKEVG